MMRKDLQPKPGSKKVSVEELRKKEKEVRRLKHELTTEKEKFNQMVAKNQADIQNLQATLYEESQARLKLSMELDTKESEVENLQMKLTHINLDAESISSGMTQSVRGVLLLFLTSPHCIHCIHCLPFQLGPRPTWVIPRPAWRVGSRPPASRTSDGTAGRSSTLSSPGGRSSSSTARWTSRTATPP